ncbi:MAG: signal peptidase II [Gemmatimonadetes bacterium]|nr:signal peptidase II [Gemmatimonadota bacterium]
MRSKLTMFATVFPVVMALDLVTKRWAMSALVEHHGETLGGLVPLTLAYNKGAAFGIHLGADSRWFFVPVTLVALALLTLLLRQASRSDYLRIFSICLVISGALGNLYDRLRWSRGVVDFIGPINLGFSNFPIFNVADSAITCGAILLAISFWLEERRSHSAPRTAPVEERTAATPPSAE